MVDQSRIRKGAFLTGGVYDSAGQLVDTRPVIIHQRKAGAPASEVRVDVVGGSLRKLSQLIAERVGVIQRVSKLKADIDAARRKRAAKRG